MIIKSCDKLGFHLEYCPEGGGGASGGIWILRGGGGESPIFGLMWRGCIAHNQGEGEIQEHAPPELLLFFLIDALKLILGLLVVMEVHTAKLSFIWFGGGGGGGGGRERDKLVLGVRGNPRASPIKENLVCVDSPVVVVFCCWLRWLLPG